MFEKILIANRGEIALRIQRACREMGIRTVVVHSTADTEAKYVKLADESVCIGPAPARESYLNMAAIISAAEVTDSQAIHPGYGFLSENADFAERVERSGFVFIGPHPENIRLMGDKVSAKQAMEKAGVPCVPGSEGALPEDAKETVRLARKIGYPVIIKAAAGGGGRGMRVVHTEAALLNAVNMTRSEAQAAFGNATVYMERYVGNARHIEVQILGDEHGNVIHLGERDCSLQRRHQKIIEEAPAYAVPQEVRTKICNAAAALARSIGYRSAGTIEFIYDNDTEDYYFLEMNTRIQVEHPVTEMITGVDLVAQQLLIARGEPLPFRQSEIKFTGHAIECRITAESPQHGFRPCPGLISNWQGPTGPGIRLDTHCYSGYFVPPYYDSLLAKLIVHANSRIESADQTNRALENFHVSGIDTLIPFLKVVIADDDYRAGKVNTRWLEKKLEDYAAAQPG